MERARPHPYNPPLTIRNLVVGKEYVFVRPKFTNDAVYNFYAWRQLSPDELTTLNSSSTVKLVGTFIEISPNRTIKMGDVRLAFLESQKKTFESTITPGEEIIYPNRLFNNNPRIRDETPCLTQVYEYTRDSIMAEVDRRTIKRGAEAFMSQGLMLNQYAITPTREFSADELQPGKEYLIIMNKPEDYGLIIHEFAFRELTDQEMELLDSNCII